MHMCRYPVLHLHHSFPIIFEQQDSQKSLLCASYNFVCSHQTYLACLLMRFVNIKTSRGSFHIPHSTVLSGEHSRRASKPLQPRPTQRDCSASCPRWPIHGLGLRDTRCIIQAGGLATWRKSCVRMAYTSPPNRRYVLLVAAAFSPPRLSHRRYSMCFLLIINTRRQRAMIHSISLKIRGAGLRPLASPVRGEVVHRQRLARAPG